MIFELSRSMCEGRCSKQLVDRLFAVAKTRGERLPIRISPTVSADTWEELAEKREQARALLREGLMLKARDGAYGIGRRKGDDRTDVWWKWKLDPMSVDAVVIYAERGHGRRSGVYTDYTFAVWSAGEEAGDARAGALRQGLFRAVGQGNSRDGCDRPPDDGRDLRSGAKPHTDASV